MPHARVYQSGMALRTLAALTGTLLLLACTPPAAPPTSASAAVTSSGSPLTHAPVVLTYLGVAGWQVADGARALLVDPYFTRADIKDSSAVLSPDEAAIARHAPEHADAILVEHSHYDHLLDVPSIARRTGALVIGTESTLNVARAAGIESSHLRLAQGGETFEIGPFSVRAIRGLHSLIGEETALIPREIKLPMATKAYAEGNTLQYLVRVEQRTILFVGSANFIESELEGLRPDVAVLAVGLREKIPDYSCRLMRALGRPRLVLADHFDAHWKPLGPEQMSIEEESRASLMRFAGEVHACSPESKVVIPEHLRPIAILRGRDWAPLPLVEQERLAASALCGRWQQPARVSWPLFVRVSQRPVAAQPAGSSDPWSLSWRERLFCAS